MELTVDGPVCGLAHDYFNLMIVSFDCIVIRSNSMMFVTITVLMFVLMCNARFEMSMPMIMLNYMNMMMFVMPMSMMLSMSKCWGSCDQQTSSEKKKRFHENYWRKVGSKSSIDGVINCTSNPRRFIILI